MYTLSDHAAAEYKESTYIFHLGICGFKSEVYNSNHDNNRDVFSLEFFLESLIVYCLYTLRLIVSK